MKSYLTWLGDHPTVIIVAIIAVVVMVVSAMFFHYDLSWIPELLKSWL